VSDATCEQKAEALEAARRLFSGPCDFIAGATNTGNLPPASLPEIAFAGRSNAGKSSLINALTRRNRLARVSNTPGRTREINFFRLGDTLMLADLPGYGYARVSRTLAEEWQAFIFAYLRGRSSLRRVALLLDSRRGILESDREVMKLLDSAAVSFVLVLTKTDKLKPAELEAVRANSATECLGHPAAYPEVIATSAVEGTGLDELKAILATVAVS
jgi:GTP-binding protein